MNERNAQGTGPLSAYPMTTRWLAACGRFSRAWALLLFCLTVAVPLGSPQAEPIQTERKTVVVVNSYHWGAEWAEGEVNGILSELKSSGLDFDLFIEQMDILRRSRSFDELHFLNHLQMLYGDRRIDLVIVTDDAALSFVTRHYGKLFPGAPVVFSDVGRLDDLEIPANMPVTGVMEHTAFLETIEVARRVRPNASKILVFGNEADNGSGPRNAQKALSELQLDIPLQIITDLGLEEMAGMLSRTSPEDIVIPLALASDRNGRRYTYEQVNEYLARTAPTPMFVFWSLGIKAGHMLGGKVNDPGWQGAAAASMGVRILKGEDARDIPILRKAPTEYLFSYLAMRRYDIPESALPPDSIVLHKPVSVYEQNRTLVWTTLAVVATLIVVNTLLLLNIRRRRTAEQALRSSEQRFRSVFEHAPMGIALVEGEQGKIVASNPNMQALVGYRDEELRNVPFGDITHPNDLAKDIDQYHALLRGDISHFSMEKRYLHKNGAVVWAYLTVSAIESGEKPPRYVIGMMEDITQRKRAEDELQDSIRRLETVVTGAPIVLFSFDQNGVFTLSEGRGLEGMGLKPGEVVGQSAFDIYHDQPKVLDNIRRAVSGETFTVRFVIAEREYLGYHTPLLSDKGEPEATIGVLVDITEQARAEEALRKLNEELEQRVTKRTAELESSNDNYRKTLDKLQRTQQDLVRSEKLAGLGNLVAGVAHELSTPLGTSVTLATALADRLAELEKKSERDELDQHSIKEFVTMAAEASKLLTRTLLQSSELIRSFKQVAVDQTSAQRRRFDLGEVIAEVVSTLHHQFKKSPHRISVSIPDGLLMDSFPGPIGQIVTNLVNNARIHAFSEDNAGEVSISAMPLDGDQVRLTVADNGRGIPREDLGKVFDPFFTTRMGQGGSGLGLHISYNLATRVLGGRIDVDSQPGEGVRFTLDIPLTAPAASTNTLSETAAPDTEA